MANCRYCGKEIIWMQEGRKKIPVENDGIKHECDEYKRTQSSARTLKPSEIDPEILKQYQENMKKATNKKK